MRGIFVVFFVVVIVDEVPADTSRWGNSVPVERFLPLRASWRNSIEGPYGVSRSPRRSHKDSVGVLRGAPSSVGAVVTVVWFEGVTADDG